MSVRANVFIRLLLIAPILAASMGACTRVERLDARSSSRSDETANSAELHRFEYTQVHMGVQARLVLFAEDSTKAERAARAAFDRIAELDGVMSDYRRGSELRGLVRQAGDGPVRISKDLLHVLTVSQQLARQSGGAFDVTVGPLVALWREARRTAALPPDRTLAKARSRSGHHLLTVDSEDGTADLQVDGMGLDLGGIAKGFAADEAIRTLAKHGARRAMIEFGGDVVAGDPPPGRVGWRITAAPAERGYALSNAAISTSGDTQQFVEIDGGRYSHVVDPRTGIGLTSRIAVTVVAPKGILSDGLATTLSVLGPDAGGTFLDEHYPEVEAVFRHAGR